MEMEGFGCPLCGGSAAQKSSCHLCKSGSGVDKLQEMEMECPMRVKGCEWKGTVQDLDQHERECKYAVVEVDCLMQSKGCEWKGNVQDLEQHEKRCEYVDVKCQSCGKWVHRRDLRTHTVRFCPRRLYECDFCYEQVPYEDIRTLHWPICKNYPEPMKERDLEFCKMRTKIEKLIADRKEDKLETALGEDKLKVAVKEKSELEAVLKQKDQQITEMRAQLTEATAMQKKLVEKVNQIEEMLGNSQQKQSQLERRVTRIDQRLTDTAVDRNREFEYVRESVTRIQSQLEEASHHSADLSSAPPVADGACAAGNLTPTFPHVRPVWVDFPISMNVNNIKQFSGSHASPTFATSKLGYRMMVDVYYKAGRRELSAHVYVLPGENDDSLQWPMRADVRIELYDPSRQCKPYMKNVDGAWDRVTRGRSDSQTVDPFITLEELAKYVRDGLLHFRIYGYVN